jgi:hypothetical protein
MFNAEFAGICMIYLHTKFHMHNFNDLYQLLINVFIMK